MIHYLPPQAEYRHCKLLLIPLKFIAPLFQVALIKTRPPPICSTLYLLIQSLLEYTVWLHNNHYLKTCKNVHTPILLLWKNVLQPLHYQTNYIFCLKNEKAYYYNFKPVMHGTISLYKSEQEIQLSMALSFLVPNKLMLYHLKTRRCVS